MEPQSSKLSDRTYVSPARPLRILLDGRKLGDGGIGVYTENLIRGLAVTPGIELTVITSPERQRPTDVGGHVRWIEDPAKPYSLDELLRLPKRIDFREFDLFHTPHYMLPLGIPIPTVVTVHDLIQITHPERFYYPWVAKMLIASAVKRADKVIAVSHHTQSEILEKIARVGDKVVWVPNAAPRLSLHVSPGHPPAGVSNPQRHGFQKKVGELSPYVLGLFSNLKPHKAFPDLVRGFLQAKEALIASAHNGAKLRLGELNPRALKLVLVGYGTEELLQAPELLKLIADNDSVHVLGRVCEEELSSLYAGAACVAIPSLAEGFCLPALEAQAVGARIVARPVPALREIVGGDVVFSRSFSLSDFVEALKEGISRPVVKGENAASSREQLARFTIEATTERIVQVYRSLISESRS